MSSVERQQVLAQHLAGAGINNGTYAGVGLVPQAFIS